MAEASVGTWTKSPGCPGHGARVSLCQARPPRPCADSPALRPGMWPSCSLLHHLWYEPLFGLHRPVKPTGRRVGGWSGLQGVLLTQGCFQSRSKQALAGSLTGPLCFCFETCSGGQPSSHRPRGEGMAQNLLAPLLGTPPPLGLLAQWGPSNQSKHRQPKDRLWISRALG